MFLRITSVIALALSVVWLCREPAWEPVLAVFTALAGYLGIEIVGARKSKQHKDNSNHLDASFAAKIDRRVRVVIERMENEKGKHPGSAQTTMQHTQEELEAISKELRDAPES